MQQLKGQVAVVTGATRGAGRGIALALGKAGATVYVTGRSRQGATMAADVMQKSGQCFRTGELAAEYGFTDADGRQVPPFLVD